jgi:hypothetical protein
MQVSVQGAKLKFIRLKLDSSGNSGVDIYHCFTGAVENLTAKQGFNLGRQS